MQDDPGASIALRTGPGIRRANARPARNARVAAAYTAGMSDDDLRRWVHDRRAAAAFERSEVRSAPTATTGAIAGALALVALSGRLHGWPIPDDPVSRREDELARARWARLRSALGGRGRFG